MIKKAIYYATAIAAMAAAAIVCVVFLALGLNAALVPVIGPAWGAAAVAGAALLVVGILAAVTMARANPPSAHHHHHESGSGGGDLSSRLFELVADKPWVALGAVAAAAAVAMKNPKITAAVISAVMAGRASKK